MQSVDHITPIGDLALQLIALPDHTNSFGDIYGGWLVAQMDIAAGEFASRLSKGRVLTIAIEQVEFMAPVSVGATIGFYIRLIEVGVTSIRTGIEVWAHAPQSTSLYKVTDAQIVFVAVDGHGKTRSFS